MPTPTFIRVNILQHAHVAGLCQVCGNHLAELTPDSFLAAFAKFYRLSEWTMLEAPILAKFGHQYAIAVAANADGNRADSFFVPIPLTPRRSPLGSEMQG